MDLSEVLGRKIAARPVNLPTCQHVATNFFSLCSLETIRRLFKYRLATIGIVLVCITPIGAGANTCDVQFHNPPEMPENEILTLELVLKQIRQASPNVRRAALEYRAVLAEVDQASKPLNPSVGIEVENFNGTGLFDGYEQSETTLSFEQTIQLGGKRKKRQSAARAKATLENAQCHLILREAELEAALLYYDLLAARDLSMLTSEMADLVDSLAQTVAKRVEAGAAAPPERSRADAASAALNASALAAEAVVDQTRYELAALWGSSSPRFSLPQDGSTVNRKQSLSKNRSDHPSVAVAKATSELRLAEQIAVRAEAVPDLAISAGIRQFESTDDTGFILGISMPIALFDRKRDAAKATGYRADAEQIRARAIEARIFSEQQAAQIRVRTELERLTLLENEALPAARAAYDATEQGYRAGRFDLTTTLDARKGLLEAGLSVIQARRDYFANLMQLNYLLGAAPFDGELQ